MKYTVQTECAAGKSQLVIYLEGELDHHSASALRENLDKELEYCNIEDCVIDMKRVSFMDSSGLGVILGRYKNITGRGGKLSIRNPNKTVDRLLRISGIYSIINISNIR